MNLRKQYEKLTQKATQLTNTTKSFEFLSPKKEDALPYAYPCDNYMEKILSLQPVKKEFKKLLNNYYKSQNIRISNIGCKVDASSFPKLQSVLKYCSDTLELKNIPEIFVSNRLKGINAIALQINEESAILISPKSLFQLSEKELRFMLGHELSHVSQGNLLCHTANGILCDLKNKNEVVGTIVADIIELPLKEWCRACEYTADRAGYLCCKDMETVISLFNKIGDENTKTKYYNYTEIYRDHPYIENRIDRIKEFAESL